MDSTNGNENMDTIEYAQPGDANRGGASPTPDPASAPGGGPGRAKWSGRTKRVVTSVAASAVLLGSGAAIGVALTGGASASTGGTSPGTTSNAATTTAATSATGRCARLAQRLHDHGHPVAAGRLWTFCKNPLLRLALVGGEHGEVTFQTSDGPKTIAVERGTVESVSSSGITVQAKDGTTWSWAYTTSTVVRDAHQVVARTSLSSGETVLVLGQVVNGVHEARYVRVRDASGSNASGGNATGSNASGS